MSRKIGVEKETLACQYLLNQNLSLITNNYYCRYGEIDLIMLDHNFIEPMLVFTEVRYRKNTIYGHPLESVNYHKRQKIFKTALEFLSCHKKYQKSQYRFDVIAILGKLCSIEWYKNIIDEELT